MSGMVERVAKLLGCLDDRGCSLARQKHPEKCGYCLERVRDAIAAMREPTEIMIKAPMEGDVTAWIWRCMIDAALKEE